MPGSQFSSKVPGWFRIIFAVRKDALEAGLDQIEKVLSGKYGKK